MTVTSASLGTASVPSNKSIRVMVVDDSAVVRGLVSRWLEEEGIEVVGRHANGEVAVKDVAKSDPDIIILDVEMPVMDGLTALPELLKAKRGVKVLMASTLTRRNAEVSLKALSLGAIDYIPKPESNSGITTSTSFRRELIDKVQALGGRGRVTKNVTSSLQEKTTSDESVNKPISIASNSTFSLRPFSKVVPRVLAIGSSTGGPQALMAVMKEIKDDVAGIPVVITQHMPPTFTTILAEHLTGVMGRLVKEGGDGDLLNPGSVYVAPGAKHMLVEEQRGGQSCIKLDDGPEVNFCKPAVDPMFKSLSQIYKSSILSIVLTGMGQDGAVGAGVIADAGGSVIVQDEATSVVWGMPGSTANMGNASAVLPLSQIGSKVKMLIKGGV